MVHSWFVSAFALVTIPLSAATVSYSSICYLDMVGDVTVHSTTCGVTVPLGPGGNAFVGSNALAFLNGNGFAESVSAGFTTTGTWTTTLIVAGGSGAGVLDLNLVLTLYENVGNQPPELKDSFSNSFSVNGTPAQYSLQGLTCYQPGDSFEVDHLLTAHIPFTYGVPFTLQDQASNATTLNTPNLLKTYEASRFLIVNNSCVSNLYPPPPPLPPEYAVQGNPGAVITDITGVPEPGTVYLTIGLAGALWVRWKLRR